jgi:hypothetical protein
LQLRFVIVLSSHSLMRIVPCGFLSAPGSSPEYLLHTRPMFSPSLLPLPVFDKCLTPMVQLVTAQKLQSDSPTTHAINQTPLSVTRLAGLPVLQYQLGSESVECTGIFV